VSTSAIAAILAIQAAPQIEWTPREDLDRTLPASIRVREGSDTNMPLRAWVVEAGPDPAHWRPRAVLADDVDGVEPVQRLAREAGAFVAINAGYFGEGKSLSLVVEDGRTLSTHAATIRRGGIDLHPTRATFGIAKDGAFDIAWAFDVAGTLHRYPEPNPFRAGVAQASPSATFPVGGSRWDVRLAIGGGPMLVESGHTRITFDEEAFPGSGLGDVDARHPRTALGYTQDGRILLLVVDGRAGESIGATLADLARVLTALGAVEALNLDGGGSSTLVVAGQIVNHPSEESGAREVASAFALVPPERGP